MAVAEAHGPEDLDGREKRVSGRVHADRIVVGFRAKCAKNSSSFGDVERVPLISKLQLSKGPQSAMDGAFVHRGPSLLSERTGKRHCIPEPFEVRSGRSRVRRAEVGAAQIVERSTVQPAVTSRYAVSPNAEPGRAVWNLRRTQCGSVSADDVSSPYGEPSGMDKSNGWRISATNSARPLTPAFA